MPNQIISEIPRIWLNEKQAAEFLGVSRTTLYRLRLNEEIAYSKIGRILRYRREDLDNFLLNNYINAVHPP